MSGVYYAIVGALAGLQIGVLAGLLVAARRMAALATVYRRVLVRADKEHPHAADS